MRVIRLEIFKCDRFKLTEKDLFIFTPEKDIEIISGTSGIGKSTLLEYSLPYPKEKGDFLEGGYCILELSHAGSIYIISSNYKGEHSISKDDIFLSKGRTRKEMIQVAEEEFGLTMELFKILSGRQSFTSSSPAQRKDWISLLATVDLTYAFGVYKRITDRIKDLKSTIKVTNLKIVELDFSSKLKDEIIEVGKEVDDLDFLRTEILSRNYKEFNPSIEEDIRTTIRECKSLQSRLLPIETFTFIKDVSFKLERVVRRIEYIEEEIDKASDIIDLDVTDLIVRKSDLEDKVKMIELSNYLSIPVEAIDSLNIYLSNSHSVSFITKLSNLYISFTDRDNFIDLYHTTKLQMEIRVRSLEQLRDKLDVLKDMKNKDSVSCPKCSTTFRPGYNEVIEMNLLKQIEEDKNKLLSVELKFKTLDEEYIRLKELEEILEGLKYFIKSNTYLNALSSLEVNIFNRELSGELSTFINSILVYLSIAEDLPTINNEIREIDNKVSIVTSLNEKTAEKNNRLVERLNKNLNRYNRLKSKYLEYNGLLEKDLSLKVEIEKRIEKLRAYKPLKDEYRSAMEDRFIKDIMDDFIITINERLNYLKDKLKKYNDIGNKAEVYGSIIEECKSTLLPLINIAKGLDPKTGLIAKSIESFLGEIISHVNIILNEVFFYPIEISMDYTLLDYKFLLTVRETRPVPDISLGSTGQKTIINLAFLIVTYKMLGLPFQYLFDEVTGNIDKFHRNRLFNYILSLSETVDNQIFLVTHNDVGKLETSSTRVTNL